MYIVYSNDIKIPNKLRLFHVVNLQNNVVCLTEHYYSINFIYICWHTSYQHYIFLTPKSQSCDLSTPQSTQRGESVSTFVATSLYSEPMCLKKINSDFTLTRPKTPTFKKTKMIKQQLFTGTKWNLCRGIGVILYNVWPNNIQKSNHSVHLRQCFGGFFPQKTTWIFFKKWIVYL